MKPRISILFFLTFFTFYSLALFQLLDGAILFYNYSNSIKNSIGFYYRNFKQPKEGDLVIFRTLPDIKTKAIPKDAPLWLLKKVKHIEGNLAYLAGTHKYSYDSKYFGLVNLNALKTVKPILIFKDKN